MFIVRRPLSQQSTDAFTLIEMSIVLVIIALVVGGVVAGRQMIEAAEIRSGVSQIDRYKSAYQGFRLKYGCIPGDCAYGNRFGFGDVYGWGTGYSRGDGDGLIYSYDDGSTISSTGMPRRFESWLTMHHLYDSNMVTEEVRNNKPNVTNFPIAKSFMIFTSLRPDQVPTGYITPDKGGNYLYFGTTYPGGSAPNFIRIDPALTPVQAFNIDNKMDDGLPLQGSVRASRVSYDCAVISSSWRQGPCYSLPYTTVNVAAFGGNAVASATINDTVTPAIYRVNSTPIVGYEQFWRTSLHVPVD